MYNKMFSEVTLQDILNEVSKSITKGYGAGGIITPDTVEHPFNPRSTLYCGWTSLNTLTGNETDCIVIDAGEEVSDYQMANIVQTFKN
jgi:hypothetical protein